MNKILFPRESGEFIARKAEHVKINVSGIKSAAQMVLKHLQSKDISSEGTSQVHMHPKIPNEEVINWLFLIDTLNFCFWSSEAEHWSVTWRGKTYSGYYALCAAMNRALDEGYSIINPQYYSQISLRDLKTILRGDNELISIPLLNKRLDCLHEVGLTLLERFDGKFLNCVLSSNGSAKKLLQIIVDNFPCFKDEATYKGQKVSFYKRAQILIGDIWICFKGKNEGYFDDIDELTMFADYRVPQVLVYFKILEYSNTLLEKLNKGVILKSGSNEEVEIRGCTIHAVELINQEIKNWQTNVIDTIDAEKNEGFVKCNSVLIDHYFWNYRRKYSTELQIIPFHKTLSINY